MDLRGRTIVCSMIGICLPFLGMAQDGGWADSVNSLHSVLAQLYKDLIGKCEALIDVSRGIAGFAAIWYIGARVWRHIANAESIDLLPLFRPFIVGFVIMAWGSCVALFNGILQPIETSTGKLVENSDKAVAALLKQKEEAIKSTDIYQMYLGDNGAGDYDKWYKYTHPEDPNRENEDWLESIGNGVRFELAKMGYSFRNKIKEVIAEILQLLFAAASLCINTMRTFNLIILAILGPLVFGLSVFDGFQHTLKHWIARYINVFLWLPICNIFAFVIGSIQENMLKIDLDQIGQQGDTFFSRTDAGYMIFMIIGIIGYTTVPAVANYVMFVGGGDALTSKTSGIVGAGAGMAGGMAMAAGGSALSVAGHGLSRARHGMTNMAYAGENIDAGLVDENTNPKSRWSKAGRAFGQASNYLRKKLKGN